MQTASSLQFGTGEFADADDLSEVVITASPTVGHSHAKAILMGEHAVVYGAPAVALPVYGVSASAELIDGEPWSIHCPFYQGSIADAPEILDPIIAAWRGAVERVGKLPGHMKLVMNSTIPIHRGLGSSAAVAAAVVDAAAATAHVELSRDERYELIQKAELVAHDTPSGVDAATVVSSGPILFERGIATSIPVTGDFTFVIADTGFPGSTAEAVASVRQRTIDKPAETQELIQLLADLSRSTADMLASGQHAPLGKALDRAHGALTELGVSSDHLNALVRAARNAGALGAKLTGGGIGGCIILLSPTADTSSIEHALREAGAVNTWTTCVGGRG